MSGVHPVGSRCPDSNPTLWPAEEEALLFSSLQLPTQQLETRGKATGHLLSPDKCPSSTPCQVLPASDCPSPCRCALT